MNGKVIFAEIPRLNIGWQNGTPSSDPSDVWTVWDKNTYYLWGANGANITGIPIGQSLNGGGLAGPNGPSRGLAHPHYVGINTMDFSEMFQNVTVFNELSTHLADGKNIVIPIFHDSNMPIGEYKYSLGTGLGSNVNSWICIQKFIFHSIIKLCGMASDLIIPTGVYWPDCRQKDNPPHYPIKDIADMVSITMID